MNQVQTAHISQKTRKVDKKLHNKFAEDFIPIACHYNDNTLLTKNGELIQIIQINGINAEHISDKLLNLREMLGEAIRNNAPKDGSVAFWLHTIRRKSNLDDQTPYNKIFSANLHNVWKEKNYWHDKFVNTLYISIMHASEAVKLVDVSTILNSFFYQNIKRKADEFLDNAYLKLNEIVNNIINDLEGLGANKLGISFEGGHPLSDMIFLYRRIVRLNEDVCLTPISDLGEYIATDKYAIGGDKIEVKDNNENKFTAILSIKEYHNLSVRAIDRFLQLPIELIATEVFYFIDKKNVIPAFKEQNEFLRISGDEKLANAKGLDEIFKPTGETIFCNQQITLSLISENVENLEKKITQASEHLSEIGIVHVREDINLEQTFWAQLPGNFKYLRRLNPTVIENTAALASLHNFPMGMQYSVWGKYVTLLRTEKGTPYFMNFHNDQAKGNTGIIGGLNSGRTVLTNFFISESTKYNPNILYLSTSEESEIFTCALEGLWINADNAVINPLLLENNLDNKLFVYEFLKIIFNHHVQNLPEGDLKFLEGLTERILDLPEGDRILSKILKSKSLLKNISKTLKERIEEFEANEEHNGIFDIPSNVELKNGDTLGINLYKFSDEYYTSKYLPDEAKLLDKFNGDLLRYGSVRAGILYALYYHHNQIDSSSPKIFVLDNALSLINAEYFKNIINEIFYSYAQNNGIVLANFSLEMLIKKTDAFANLWLELLNTTIILPNDAKQSELKQKLQMSQLEIDKLANISNISRLFLFKQSGSAILLELSIGGMIGFVKILSSTEEDREVFRKLYETGGGNIEQWLNPLYQALEKN